MSLFAPKGIALHRKSLVLCAERHSGAKQSLSAQSKAFRCRTRPLGAKNGLSAETPTVAPKRLTKVPLDN
eukprot:872145-Alexandrium_andersonii.AAC.1